MRLRIEVTTTATVIPWDDVLRPGRGIVYRLLNEGAPALAERLHADGWRSSGMVPFGYGAPVFPKARYQRGRYAAGGAGYWELGSPLTEVVEAWRSALSGYEYLSWGGTPFRVREVVPVEPPAFRDGRAELRTSTPVVVRVPVPAGNAAEPVRRVDRLPYEDGFLDAFQRNLHRKAEALDLVPDLVVEHITWIGAKRSFAIKQGRQVGAPLGVRLSGNPEALRALWSWGLGNANSAGFGWVTG